MPQTRFHFTLPTNDARRLHPVVEAAFEEDGFPLGITEHDDGSGVATIELYADEGSDAPERLHAIAADAGLTLDLGSEVIPDVDWVTRSLEGLAPVRAARFVVHGSHDRDKPRQHEIAIEIEAGLAFGTGHHGTTAGCLEMIARLVRTRRPLRALDLGTGSAVLAIALARLTHRPVLATDIDPVAVAVARDNIRSNRVADLVHAVTATGFGHTAIARGAPYDLIVANILARPLMRLAPAMAAHILPGGSLILSGILSTQRNAVVAAYVGQRFRHVRTLTRGEWVTLHLQR